MLRDLTDRVIIITGASSGIGAATAVACAEAGMDVVLTARREDRLAAVAEQVRNKNRRAVIVAGEVTDAGMAGRLLDAASAELGRFDAVFANAGYGAQAEVLAYSMDETRRMFEVNFFAALELAREAAMRWIELGSAGHVLMCTSCLARFSLPKHGVYSATKAAQQQVCGAMRGELRQYGIEVSSVLPITTATEFFEVSARNAGREVERGHLPGHAPRFFVQSPQRVAQAVVRCLRKPRAEVWTSHTVRFMAGLMTMFPRLGDWVGARASQRE